MSKVELVPTQTKFELVPDQKVVEEKQVTKQFASVWFNIYRHGIELDAKFGDVTVDGDTLSVGKGVNGWVHEKVIEFANNYAIKAANLEQSERLMKWQGKLPKLITAFCEKFHGSKTYVDLLSGKEVDRGLTVEYEFKPQVTETVKTETVKPGYIVFTTCALVSEKVSATYDGLTITYLPVGVASKEDGYCFRSFGKLDLFDRLDSTNLGNLRHYYSDQVIEGAFRQLTIELAKRDQMKSVPSWTTKQVVEIE